LTLTLLHFMFITGIAQVDDRQCTVGNNSIPDCQAVLVEEVDDEEDRYYEEDVISWDELPLERKSYYLSLGWTREKWNLPDEYHMRHWRDLSEEQLKAVMTLGWTEENWTSGDDDPDAYSKTWGNLTPEEVDAATVLGYSRETWHTKAAIEDFSPIVFPLSIPELESMNLNYLEALEVKVGVVDGTATLDDEEIVRYEIAMSEYIKLLRAGSKLYLKYEDHDPIKAHISSTIGSKILTYMRDALSKSPLRDMGYYLDKYDKWPLFEDNYSFFVGGTNTSTPMHYDVDEFNVLWLVEGRKRVVLIPNDERTIDRYDCVSSFAGHSCWTGENILDGPLPEFAVEVELGPGDGLFIPGKTWHAVKNLEPSVAYGLRIESSQYKV
jgi:mannose-6-phosphate isomerase-like protein (cupin superfamily)